MTGETVGAAPHDARCPIWRYDDPDDDLCTCRDAEGHAPAGWGDGPMCAFDLETTTADPEQALIVTASLVTITPGSAPRVVTWLADPGVAIPDEAVEVHGVTTDHARTHGRPAREVVAEVAAALDRCRSAGWPTVAYNAGYDLTVLARELARHDLPPIEVGWVIDPLVIDKAVDRYRKGSRRLADTAAHYRVTLAEAHDAAGDAVAAARVAWRIARDHPEIGCLPLGELHRRQVEWYREQQTSFADYLRRKIAPTLSGPERQAVLDRADDVDAAAGGWPVRPTGGAR